MFALTFKISALDAGVKLRFTEKELKLIGPEFTKKWQSYYASRSDSPAMWIGPVSMYVYFTG